MLQYIKDNKLINDYTSIILEALEYKYSDSFICPICDFSHVTKNGHYKNGLQRLYCHECQKSFSIYKGTILEGTKLPIMIWFKYLLIMSKDEDLRDCAQYAGVSLKTIFYMRHKIMNPLTNEMNTVKLEGIAEIDETNAYISYSGNFKKQNTDKELPRKSYQRGRKSILHRKHTIIDDGIIKNVLERYDEAHPKVNKKIEPDYIKTMRRMLEYKEDHLRFMKDFTVPYTNNRAERMCRVVKAHKNISHLFVTMRGGKAYASITSIIQTAKYKERERIRKVR